MNVDFHHGVPLEAKPTTALGGKSEKLASGIHRGLSLEVKLTESADKVADQPLEGKPTAAPGEKGDDGTSQTVDLLIALDTELDKAYERGPRSLRSKRPKVASL